MLFPEQTSPEPSDNGSYLVFARKYRPQNFQQLIGQNHLVETLTNAFDNDRIGHAYILTGVRGVGKTTTARIIAKGLNCLAHDKPTINPCGDCQNCTSITNGKNIDVFEMDAASRTGIDDIREIIDSIPYKPLNCRYKVYIIDEVHMLSKQAFNGLLKTLEEPPEHVKFIFATTEIHKILPTILSRCQRIDLKRIQTKELTTFFGTILDKENITYDQAALAKIASNADGSVRDGLSLLDQAVAMCAGHIQTQTIIDMLGTTQGNDILDIIKDCLAHNPTEALNKFHNLYKNGLDCSLFIKELLRLTELLVKFKFTPDIIDDPSLDEAFIQNITQIAESAEVHLLSRMWEIALKATQDIKIAPNADAVCEMAIIRMNYGLNLPDPVMMMKSIVSQQDSSEPKNEEQNINTEETKKKTSITADFLEDLLKILSTHKHLDLVRLLEAKSIIHHFSYGRIHLSAAQEYEISRKEILGLKRILHELTEKDWEIELLQPPSNNKTNSETQQSLYEQKKATQEQLIHEAAKDPIIKTILEIIPGAKIAQISDAFSLPDDKDLIKTEETVTED